jgi:hypothetical protein
MFQIPIQNMPGWLPASVTGISVHQTKSKTRFFPTFYLGKLSKLKKLAEKAARKEFVHTGVLES